MYDTGPDNAWLPDNPAPNLNQGLRAGYFLRPFTETYQPVRWRSTSPLDVRERFNKIFANAGGTYVELDTAADPHYNATGLLRVHAEGVNPQIGPRRADDGRGVEVPEGGGADDGGGGRGLEECRWRVGAAGGVRQRQAAAGGVAGGTWERE
jgi:hypothetical protein